jgi:hypothetical protein
MQYTVIKSEGKYFIMEHLDDLPLLGDFIEWEGYSKSFANKLPTLPEHSDYWAKLEGKVIDRNEFSILKYTLKDIYAVPMDIEILEWVKQNIVPKQESQEDLWDEVINQVAPTNSILDSYKRAVINFLQQQFTITRK